MRETSLNTSLCKSFINTFKDIECDCIKYSASRFGIAGMPDLQGVFIGLDFNIEGKMLKPLKKSKDRKFTISKRDGNKSGCSNVQNQRMDALEAAGSLVFMAYYKHFDKKGVYLIPRFMLHTDKLLLDFISAKPSWPHWEQYFCPYVKGQQYDVRDVFLKNIGKHFTVSVLQQFEDYVDGRWTK